MKEQMSTQKPGHAAPQTNKTPKPSTAAPAGKPGSGPAPKADQKKGK